MLSIYIINFSPLLYMWVACVLIRRETNIRGIKFALCIAFTVDKSVCAEYQIVEQ
jgi:hypothetical protein